MYSSPPPDRHPPQWPPPGTPGPGASGRDQYYSVVSPPPRTHLPTIRIAKPTLPQWLLLIGGALVVLGAFLPWFAVSLTGDPHAQSIVITGWQSAFGKATGALGLAALVLALLHIGGVQLPPALLIRQRLLFVVLGAEALLLSVLCLLDGVRVVTVGSAATSAAVAAGIGLYAAILGALSILAGGLLADQKGPLLP